MRAYSPPTMLNITTSANVGLVTPTVAVIIQALVWVYVWVWAT